MHPLEALKANGFDFITGLSQADFDYPLDFFMKDFNMVLGEVTEEARGIKVVLNPFDLHKEWYIEDEDQIEAFIEEFEATFDEYVAIINKF